MTKKDFFQLDLGDTLGSYRKDFKDSFEVIKKLGQSYYVLRRKSDNKTVACFDHRNWFIIKKKGISFLVCI